MTINDIKKIVEPIFKRVQNIFSRAIINGSDDTKGIQRVKASLYTDEIHDNMERFQNYGFTANPLDGSEALAIFHSGNREHGVIIAVENRKYRLKGLKKGEVAIYTDEGDKIHFKRGNKIEITTKELTINAADKVIVNTKVAEVVAKESAEVTSPLINAIASESINFTTPILNVSGLIQCAGIGAGVAPVAGKAKVAGDIEVTGKLDAVGDVSSAGQVKDQVGTMADIRTKYNSHKHNITDPIPTPLM